MKVRKKSFFLACFLCSIVLWILSVFSLVISTSTVAKQGKTMPSYSLSTLSVTAHLSNDVLDLYFREQNSDTWYYQYKPGEWGESCYYEHYAIYTADTGTVESENFTIDSPFSNPGGGPGTISCILYTGDIQVTRTISLSPGDVSQFQIQYKIKNIGSETINDVKFFETIDFDIPETEYPEYTNDYGIYDESTDNIWIIDYAYFRDTMVSDRRSDRHGIDYYYTELWDDWDDGELNGESYYGPGDPAIGKQFNLGNFSPDHEEIITFTIKYDLSVAPDLTISKIEVNQAIQKEDAPVPLIAGKHTVVRAYIDNGPASKVPGVTAKLHVRQNGSEIPGSPFSPIPTTFTAKDEPSQDNLDDTLNFYLYNIPAGNYEFYVVVDPDNNIYESDESNNSYSDNYNFNEGRKIKLIYYRIDYNDTIVSQKVADTAPIFLRATYPLPFSEVEWEYKGILHWDKDLSQEDNQWKLYTELNRRLFWYNIFHFWFDDADFCVGYLPEDALPDSTGYVWIPPFLSPPVLYSSAAVVEHNPGYTRRTLSHEIGHLFGLGDEYNLLDPPTITSGGFDVDGITYKNRVVPSSQYTIYNIMNNKREDRSWITTESYKSIYGGLSSSMAREEETYTASQEQEYIYLTGVIHQDDTVDLDPFYCISATVTPTSFPGGPYAIEFWDQTNNVLAGYNFDLSFEILSDPPRAIEAAPFSFVVPYPSNTSYIVFKHDGDVIKTVTVSEHAPSVAITSPNGGETLSGVHDITWTASDPDGDTLTYSVLYTPDGSSWIPLVTNISETSYPWDTNEVAGGSNCYIKVIATDGINTGQDRSDAPFTVSTKGPTAVITSPEDNSNFGYGSVVTFNGIGNDLEDGMLEDPQLEWSSSIDGYLGSGQVLTISNLSEGTHTITLTATDSEGLTGTDTITINVVRDTEPPAPPTGLSAIPGDLIIDLSWSPNSESDLAGYKVYYGWHSSGSYDAQIDVGNVTIYQLSGLNNGTTYYIAITAYDTSGNESDFSSEVSATPTGDISPTLSWTEESGYEEDGLEPEIGNSGTEFTYRVKYTDEDNDAPKEGYPKVHILKDSLEITGSPFTMSEADSSDTTYTDGKIYTYAISGLSAGTDYTYYFEAYDAYDAQATGEPTSQKDGPIVDTTAPTVTLVDYPDSIVKGNLPQVDVTFSWQGSDNVTSPENLVYQYKLEGYPDYENWSDWTSETIKIYTLPSGEYTFKVRAKDEAGNYPEENEPATASYSFTVSLPIIVYPNPCYLNKGQIVTIANLPLNSKVLIYTISGELVRTLDDATEITIEGGSATATWDLRNDAGNLVAQGVYIYLVPEATGDKRTGKIAIIK